MSWPTCHLTGPAQFAAIGRAVQSLQGAYITAEDVGTTTADMLGMQTQTQLGGVPPANLHEMTMRSR